MVTQEMRPLDWIMSVHYSPSLQILKLFLGPRLEGPIAYALSPVTKSWFCSQKERTPSAGLK